MNGDINNHIKTLTSSGAAKPPFSGGDGSVEDELKLAEEEDASFD